MKKKPLLLAPLLLLANPGGAQTGSSTVLKTDIKATRSAAAPAPVLPDLAQQARLARESGRYADARAALETALPRAIDPATAVRLRFELALTHQLEGETNGNEASLRQAVALYQEVLAAKPDSAASWCNLARAHARLGNPAAAWDAYEHSITLDTPERPYYQRKYAEYLAELGDTKKAAELLTQVAIARPGNDGVHEQLVALHLTAGAAGVEPLVAYAWRLLAAGQAPRALEAALQGLAGPARGELAVELAAVIAASLGQGPANAREILGAPTTRQLGALTRHPDVGAGLAELLGLLKTSAAQGSDLALAARLPWWAFRASEVKAPARGVWPQEAARGLILALGRGAELRGDFAAAEHHYRAAITFTPYAVNPVALRHLVELFITRNDLPGLEAALQQYEQSTFESKGVAYREGQLETIYAFHQTLGELYGYLASQGTRPWGSLDEPRTALFQLQRAYELGQQLESRAAARATLSPNLVEYLARGYDATSKPELATRVRLDAAVRFNAAADPAARDFLLRSIKTDQLRGVELDRYRDMVKTQPPG